MPYLSNPLLAPVFQSPVGDGRDHRPPVVSIKRAEDAVESGIRLHHNQRVEGYILQPEVEGLGVAPVELQTAPLASGGSVARHTRLAEGDVFLPITLVSPVPSALPSMFDALVDIARPGQRDEDGLPYQFEVVVFDPYGQETRSRRLIFESGLGDPVRVNHHVWRTSITGRFVDPFWYGTVRELRRVLGSVDKKFITAHPGAVAATFEWEGERNASPSVKIVDGEIVARNLVPNPSFELGTGHLVTTSSISNIWRNTSEGYSIYGEYNTRIQYAGTGSATSLWVYENVTLPDDNHSWLAFGMNIGQNYSGENEGFRLVVRPRDSSGAGMGNFRGEDNVLVRGNADTRYVMAIQLPDGAVSADVGYEATSNPGGSWVNPSSDTSYYIDGLHADTGETEAEALAKVTEYFDGDTPPVLSGDGAYEFPFFPVRIGGSVVQGEYELTVEGDAPAYWSGVITPPGEDLLIQNAQGERIFVKGRVDEPILIQTRPQEQDITLADGTPIWDRIDPGDDDFFPLHPGKNTVHVSMVGATQQSEILIRYREAFFHALGGGS